MVEEENKRQFTRFENNFHDDQKTPSLHVRVPALADGALQPENFSVGGFRLKLPKPAEIGAEMECTVTISNITLSGLKSRIAWVEDGADSNSPSFAGLSIQVSDGERDILSSLLTAILTGTISNN